MKHLIIFIALLALTFSSCQKKDINPNVTNTESEEADTKNGNCSGEATDDGYLDDNNPITDPNNDEDESKTTKKK